MKAKEVLKLLKITRPTLCKYVKEGIISVKEMPNGTYDYNEDDVFKKFGFEEKRKCVVYARVSTQKQKKDLENQIQVINNYANSNGFIVDNVYSDIASGLNFDRCNFQQMLHEILEHKIKTVIVKDKDRLTRISFEMWKKLFSDFNCELIVVNNVEESGETQEKELFADIISLLHCFAMKMYSSRRKKKIQLVEEDLENEISL